MASRPATLATSPRATRPSKEPPLRRTTTARRRAYRQLLRDPRWQQTRLRIFARDSWTCQACGATTKELQVHHKWYVAGVLPWDVPPQALVTLCVDCHATQKKRR